MVLYKTISNYTKFLSKQLTNSDFALSNLGCSFIILSTVFLKQLTESSYSGLFTHGNKSPVIVENSFDVIFPVLIVFLNLFAHLTTFLILSEIYFSASWV